MATIYDLAYRTLLALGVPLMWARPALRAKLAAAHRERNGDVPRRNGLGRCVLIHAVSVGEVSATRELVLRLMGATGRPPSASADLLGGEEGGPLHIVISVTTDTGFERAQQIYSDEPFVGHVSVVRYPMDLSPYVRRFLDRLQPDVAVLMELEVWPNFVLECSRRGIPVALVNGRLTERSYRHYRLLRRLVRPMYAALSAVCAQEQTYAQRFIALGVSRERVTVTGTMKFDSAQVGEHVEGNEELSRALALSPKVLGGYETVLVCGSTGPGEEELLLEVFARLRARHPGLRLIIVPRKPERFDEVAQLMSRAGEVLRRSQARPRQKVARGKPQASQPAGGGAGARPLILGDTMGELRKFYSLADLVVVGRTLLDLGEKQHGSDMIEPAALGKPVVVGPWTGNFAEPMRVLLAADAIRQIGQSRAARRPAAIVEPLVEVLDSSLRDPASAAAVGRRAREVVLANRGATQRNVQVILDHLRAVGKR